MCFFVKCCVGYVVIGDRVQNFFFLYLSFNVLFRINLKYNLIELFLLKRLFFEFENYMVKGQKECQKNLVVFLQFVFNFKSGEFIKQ